MQQMYGSKKRGNFHFTLKKNICKISNDFVTAPGRPYKRNYPCKKSCSE